MRHLRDLPLIQTPYHSEWQRAREWAEHITALWTAADAREMQQHLWLASLKMVGVGVPAQACIDLLGALLVTMRDCDAVERGHLYQGRLAAMHRTGWRMVYTAERKHRGFALKGWEAKAVSHPDADFDVIER